MYKESTLIELDGKTYKGSVKVKESKNQTYINLPLLEDHNLTPGTRYRLKVMQVRSFVLPKGHTGDATCPQRGCDCHWTPSRPTTFCEVLDEYVELLYCRMVVNGDYLTRTAKFVVTPYEVKTLKGSPGVVQGVNPEFEAKMRAEFQYPILSAPGQTWCHATGTAITNTQ